MTLISKICFIINIIGVVSFSMWDNDIEVPLLYPFGKFLGDFWFHDELKPGKPHLEKHELDGPPLVVSVAGGGGNYSNNFNYPFPTTSLGTAGFMQFGTDSGYTDSRKMSEEYTPVNGLYGVTNQRESDPTQKLEYYPNAVEPNDYIAKRFLGSYANWTDLEGMSSKEKPHNTKAFPEQTPFFAAQIGPGKPDDERWKESTKYRSVNQEFPIMPPLTSMGTGMQITTQQGVGYDINTEMSYADYSGGEYNQSDTTFQNSKEQGAMEPFRPNWYKQDYQGNPIDSKYIASWPSEYPNVPTNPGTQSNQNQILPVFYDPQYDGVYAAHSTGRETSWGDPTNQVDTARGNISSSQIQKDYIYTQLAQENPITYF